MAPRFAFLLNLDAERELAGEPVDVFAALEHRPALVEETVALVREEALILRDSQRTRSAAGLVGRAWCPTPRALDALSRAGAVVPAAPPLEVLRSVNDRRFSVACASKGPYEAWFASSAEEAARILERESPTGSYLLKQPLSFAGRGRLVTTGLDARTSRFVGSSIERFGGVAIEPLYDRTLDVAIHGLVLEQGGFVLGEPTITAVARGGVFTSSRRARPGELTLHEERTLREEGGRVANVLAAAAFFGPFGLDGFRYRLGDRDFFAPRCEINARYTMGWATGMGDLRPDLDA